MQPLSRGDQSLRNGNRESTVCAGELINTLNNWHESKDVEPDDPVRGNGCLDDTVLGRLAGPMAGSWYGRYRPRLISETAS